MTYYEEIYKPLIGFRIVGYRTEDNYPIFEIQRGDEQFDLVASRDPEGNGGGFLFIEETNSYYTKNILKEKA